MKRGLVVMLVTGCVLLTGLNLAVADSAAADAEKEIRAKVDFRGCDRRGPGEQGRAISTVDRKKYERFLADTKELRAAMAARQQEAMQLMQSAKPDKAKIALLTNEIYDLRDQLLAHAKKAGINTGAAALGGGCRCRPFGGGPEAGKQPSPPPRKKQP